MAVEPMPGIPAEVIDIRASGPNLVVVELTMSRADYTTAVRTGALLYEQVTIQRGPIPLEPAIR